MPLPLFRRLEKELLPSIGQSIARMPMVWCVGLLVVGIATEPVVAIPWLCLSTLVVALLTLGLSTRHSRWQNVGVLVAGLSAVLAGHTLSTLQAPPSDDPLSRMATRAGQPIALKGVIRSAASWRPNPNHRPEAPNSKPWRTHWEILCTGVMVDEDWVATRAFTTLSTDGRVSDLLPGDRVTVWGSYRALPKATNPGEFDLAEAMRLRHQFWSVNADSRDQIESNGNSGLHPVRRVQARVARRVDSWLRRSVGPQHAPLAAALIIGQREQVDCQQQEELMATGTLHLLAISGLHLEIVASLAKLLCVGFRFRPRTQCFLPIAVCLAYAILAGGKPPVLRALIIVSTINIAHLYGRQSRIANTLAFAGFVILVMRTANLSNVGVQLSFVAVASLALLSPEKKDSSDINSRLRSLTDRSRGILSLLLFQIIRFVTTSLRISTCVWLATCPLIWMHFHVLPWIAIPLNVLISIPLSLGLVSGLITGLIGWCEPLANMFGFACKYCLSIVQSIVEYGYHFPAGHVWLPAPATAWVLCYYSTCLVWLVVLRGKKLGRLACILVALITAQVLAFAFGPSGFLGQPTAPAVSAELTELRCTFLDVGHGTSVIIELPDGKIWLYDAGQMGRPLRSFENIAEALWDLQAAAVDRLIVSHADADHYNGVLGLSKRFRIGTIASTPQFWRSHDTPVRDTLAGITDQGIPTESWYASRIEGEGSAGVQAGVAWTVLHPSRDWKSRSDNADSLCLLLEFAGKSILLPGDLEAEGLVSLTRLPPRGIDVLMAPHHGSSTLDPDELLRWCRPKWTVISGNHRAVRPSVLRQYAGKTNNLAITFVHGAVQVRISAGGAIECVHYQDGEWLPFTGDSLVAVPQ